MTFFSELRRRNVFRVGVAYVVTAWVLLQVLDVVGEILELPAWGGKLILAVLVAGFFVAVIVAWAFELTPEGIKREKDVDRSRSITAHTGRKLDRVIIAVLVVAVAYLLLDKLVLEDLLEPRAKPSAAVEPSPGPADIAPSVAVLPFVNMSGDPENEYFSDGLTETLLHVLSQLPGLKVAARTSSFAFKGQNAAINDIAAALGVAHVLEGSVQRADGRVRITAQLVRADDGFHVWSQNYTRPLEDIFAIQDEIAADVAGALGHSLLGEDAPERHVVDTTDLDAYDSYLKGLEQQAKFSYSSLDAAENHFQQALARDPRFTDARLALARNYMLKFHTGLIDEGELRSRSAPLIRQVREQDPNNAQARAYELSLDLIASGPMLGEERIGRALEELQDVLQAVPTETFVRVGVVVTLHEFYRDNDRAIEVLQAGLLVDPLQTELHRWLGRIYARTGRLEEARAALQRCLELEPGNPNAYGTMAELERLSGDLAAALEWIRRATEVDPQDHEFASRIATDLYLLGLVEEGDYWLARVQALAPGSSVARLTELDRAAGLEDTELVIALSAAMIADQVDVRQGAFDTALVYYTDAMLQAGRAREGYDFLVGVRPEIEDYGRPLPDLQGLFMQWAAIDLMTGFETFENRAAAWKRFAAAMDARGLWAKFDPSDSFHATDHLMRGRLDEAVEHFLQFEYDKPLAYDLDRYHKPLYAVFAPVYEDPRVAPALARDAERFAQLRADVVAMLQRPEWNL